MSTLGYREDIDKPEGAGDPSRVFLIASLILLVFFFLLDALSWFTERGGIFSIVSALVSVHSKPPVMDIDKGGLWLPFTILCWLVAVGFCRVFKMELDIGTRAKALLPAFIIIGGGFVLDVVMGSRSSLTTWLARDTAVARLATGLKGTARAASGSRTTFSTVSSVVSVSRPYRRGDRSNDRVECWLTGLTSGLGRKWLGRSSRPAPGPDHQHIQK